MKRFLTSLLITGSLASNASDPVHEYYMSLDDNLINAPTELASVPINENSERLQQFFIKNIGSQHAYTIEMDSDSKSPYASVTIGTSNRKFIDKSDFLLRPLIFPKDYKAGMPFAGYFGALKAYNEASGFEKRRNNASIIDSVKEAKEDDFFASMVGKKVLLPIKKYGVFTFDFDTMSKSIKLGSKFCDNNYEHKAYYDKGNKFHQVITYSVNGLNAKMDREGRCILTFDLSSDEVVAEKVEDAFTSDTENLFFIAEFQNISTFGPRIAETTGIVITKKVEAAKLGDKIAKSVKGRRSVYHGYEYLTHFTPSTSVEKDLGAILSRFPDVVSAQRSGELVKGKALISSKKMKRGDVIGAQDQYATNTVRMITDGVIEVSRKLNLNKDATGYVAHYQLKDHGNFVSAQLSKVYQHKMVPPRLLVVTARHAGSKLSFIAIDDHMTMKEGRIFDDFKLAADVNFITSMVNKIGFSEELMVDVLPIQVDESLLASKSHPEFGPLSKPVFTAAVLEGKLANKMSCNILNVEKKKGPPINQSGYYIISQKLPDDINVSTLMRNVSSVIMARYSGEDEKRISPAISRSEVMFRVDGYMDEGVKPPFVVRVKDGLFTATYEQKLDNQYGWKESSSKRDEGVFCDMINSL